MLSGAVLPCLVLFLLFLLRAAPVGGRRSALGGGGGLALVAGSGRLWRVGGFVVGWCVSLFVVLLGAGLVLDEFFSVQFWRHARVCLAWGGRN